MDYDFLHMNVLVVYDSVYKNTEKIAKAIGAGINSKAKVWRAIEVHPPDLKGVDLLIVGSPTHGGRPTPAIIEFLKKIPPRSLNHVSVAAFDTRFAREDHGLGLKILMTVIRFAAERIAKTLKTKGGILVVNPEGFIVDDKEGPLKKGELVRAAVWAKEVMSKMR